MGKKKTQMIGWKPLRRRLRRLRRRKPALYRALSVGAAALCVLAAGGLIACGTTALLARAPQAAPQVEVAALALPPTDTPVPTPEPTPTPLPTPSPTPGGGLYLQPVGDIAPESDPAINELVSPTAYLDEEDALSKFRFAGVRLGASEDYAALEGVTTFRGSNYRDGGAWGTIPEDPSKLEIVWSRVIGSLDEWSGVGWTGQASVVRWPEETRRRMNIDAAKKEKDGLTEVLYATLDGHIYFMDLEDGENTRDAIDIGAPIKGSLAVDPRGLPLMYCGQGIYEVDDKKLRCGTRIFSLIDQKLLYFLNGQDSHALRYWYAFDCSPLVDGAADTMITVGENGVLYKVRLNTVDSGEGISIEPTVERYVYSQKAKGKLGTENSLAIYNHYAFFATNIGVIQCVDLDDMSLKWCYDGLDDIDASLVIEPETEALVGLYAVNELDKRGHNGACQMMKLNALTGELLWSRDSDALRQSNENGGGGFATPAVGRQSLSGLVYFHICRTKDSGGMLYALDKATGETVWEKKMDSYGWSSPTCLYTDNGEGYVLVGNSEGTLFLLDGLTGETAAKVELRGNIEGTPAVFGDRIVIGTRSCRIYGLRIS